MLRTFIVGVGVAGLLAIVPAETSGVHNSPLARARCFVHREKNPYAGQPAAEKAGAKLFHQHCATCHGREAQGIGKAPPLISNAVKEAEPGDLFWVLRNGSLAAGMPSFSRLPEAQRWQIISWLRRRNEAP